MILLGGIRMMAKLNQTLMHRQMHYGNYESNKRSGSVSRLKKNVRLKKRKVVNNYENHRNKNQDI